MLPKSSSFILFYLYTYKYTFICVYVHTYLEIYIRLVSISLSERGKKPCVNFSENNVLKLKTTLFVGQHQKQTKDVPANPSHVIFQLTLLFCSIARYVFYFYFSTVAFARSLSYLHTACAENLRFRFLCKNRVKMSLFKVSTFYGFSDYLRCVLHTYVHLTVNATKSQSITSH